MASIGYGYGSEWRARNKTSLNIDGDIRPTSDILAKPE